MRDQEEIHNEYLTAVRYKKLWNEKYAAGSEPRGVNVTINKADAFRSVKNNFMK